MTKKVYVEIVALLEANANKKVSTILPQILELTRAKVAQSTFHKDDEGNVVAVYCYYHKQWELVSEVPYGKKASTASGLNTMCKAGTSQWTKQQRVAKKAKEALLEAVAKGEVEGESITVALEVIEAERAALILGDTPGFETLEECIK